jgi:hypothetical protein
MIERTVGHSNLFGSVTRAHHAALGGMRKELLLCPIFGVLMVLVGIEVPQSETQGVNDTLAVGSTDTTVGGDASGSEAADGRCGTDGDDAAGRQASPSRSSGRRVRSHAESMTAANALATIVRSGRVNPGFFDSTGVEALPGLAAVDLTRLRCLAKVRTQHTFSAEPVSEILTIFHHSRTVVGFNTCTTRTRTNAARCSLLHRLSTTQLRRTPR